MDTDNVDPQDGQEQDTTPIIDKVLQNNPFFKMGSAAVENVRTQSMVQSTREEIGERLAAVNAHNEELLRQQKQAEAAAKAKRTAIYVILGIFFVSILAALIWLAINAIIAMSKPVTTSDQDQQGSGSSVVTEKCKPDTCKTLAKVSSTLTLLRGEKKIYLYDSTTKKSTLTTIPEQTYHAITPFVWGKDTYVVLDPESSASALYSVTKNRQITDFNYDAFYYDINGAVYKDMTWVVNDYIVASTSGSYRLIDLATGTEKLQATERVFVRDGYYFGKEKDGMIHVYVDGNVKVGAFAAGSNLYIKNKYLVVIASTSSVQVYNQEGERNTQNDVAKEIHKISSRTRIETLNNDSSYYHINL